MSCCDKMKIIDMWTFSEGWLWNLKRNQQLKQTPRWNTHLICHTAQVY